MSSIQTIQYTIRNIPAPLDRFLRQYAKAKGKSLNETVLELLKERAHLSGITPSYSDLDFLFGSWVENKKFDEAMKDFEKIDRLLWK